MRFIHAVVFNKDEFENGFYDTGNWGDLTDGDYVVHCLYCVDNQDIIILEDNTHQPVEAMIESFLDGVRYAGSINVGGLIIDNGEVKVTKAFIVMCSNETSYCLTEVKDHLIKGNYGEVL